MLPPESLLIPKPLMRLSLTGHTKISTTEDKQVQSNKIYYDSVFQLTEKSQTSNIYEQRLS